MNCSKFINFNVLRHILIFCFTNSISRIISIFMINHISWQKQWSQIFNDIKYKEISLCKQYCLLGCENDEWLMQWCKMKRKNIVKSCYFLYIECSNVHCFNFLLLFLSLKLCYFANVLGVFPQIATVVKIH